MKNMAIYLDFFIFNQDTEIGFPPCVAPFYGKNGIKFKRWVSFPVKLFECISTLAVYVMTIRIIKTISPFQPNLMNKWKTKQQENKGLFTWFEWWGSKLFTQTLTSQTARIRNLCRMFLEVRVTKRRKRKTIPCKLQVGNSGRWPRLENRKLVFRGYMSHPWSFLSPVAATRISWYWDVEVFWVTNIGVTNMASVCPILVTSRFWT